MYSTDRSSPAPSHFSPAFLFLSRRFGGMASTPVSSIASSATNVADVLASLGDEALAAEVGSWSAELQAKVVAAASALTSTPSSTTASTSVRRRNSNKADMASSSAAASWLTPAVEPADLSAELTAIQEGERSPAPTMADDEVVTFVGNPPPADFDLGDITPATAGFLGGGGGAGGLSGADTGAGGLGSGGGAGGTTSASTATTSSATAFLAAAGGDGGTTSAPTTTPPPTPAKAGFLEALDGDMGPPSTTMASPQPKAKAPPALPGERIGNPATPPPALYVPAKAPVAKPPLADLQHTGPEPTTATAQRSMEELQRQIAAEMDNAAQETQDRWDQLPVAGGSQGQADAPA